MEALSQSQIPCLKDYIVNSHKRDIEEAKLNRNVALTATIVMLALAVICSVGVYENVNTTGPELDGWIIGLAFSSLFLFGCGLLLCKKWGEYSDEIFHQNTILKSKAINIEQLVTELTWLSYDSKRITQNNDVLTDDLRKKVYMELLARIEKNQEVANSKGRNHPELSMQFDLLKILLELNQASLLKFLKPNGYSWIENFIGLRQALGLIPILTPPPAPKTPPTDAETFEQYLQHLPKKIDPQRRILNVFLPMAIAEIARIDSERDDPARRAQCVQFVTTFIRHVPNFSNEPYCLAFDLISFEDWEKAYNIGFDLPYIAKNPPKLWLPNELQQMKEAQDGFINRLGIDRRLKFLLKTNEIVELSFAHALIPEDRDDLRVMYNSVMNIVRTQSNHPIKPIQAFLLECITFGNHRVIPDEDTDFIFKILGKELLANIQDLTWICKSEQRFNAFLDLFDEAQQIKLFTFGEQYLEDIVCFSEQTIRRFYDVMFKGGKAFALRTWFRQQDSFRTGWDSRPQQERNQFYAALAEGRPVDPLTKKWLDLEPHVNKANIIFQQIPGAIIPDEKMDVGGGVD